MAGEEAVAGGFPVIAAIGQGVGAATDLANIAFQIWEYNETKKEAARLEKKEDQAKAEAKALEAQRYGTDLQMTRSKIREEKRRYELEYAESEEEQQYQRGRSAVAQFLGTLAQKPALEDRMMKIWPARRYF